MTKTEEIKVSTSKKLTTRKKNPLPWWVELLFVQIGLPEKYLRSFLNYKNAKKAHIDKYRKRYFIVFLALFSLFYFNPLIRNASNNNSCINNYYRILKAKDSLDSRNSINRLTEAVHYCNGGKNIN